MRFTFPDYMPRQPVDPELKSRQRYRRALTGIAILAFVFILVGQWVGQIDAVPHLVPEILLSIGEALVVAFVVAWVVEPRLLHKFGDKIATQTFWSSFFSRAPDQYREAVRSLATITKFATLVQYKIRFDWADREKGVLRMTAELQQIVENRGSHDEPLVPEGWIYDSPYPEFQANIIDYTYVCPDSDFTINFLDDGYAFLSHSPAGRLVLKGTQPGKPHFPLPPGQRYVVTMRAVTFVPEQGHFPFFAVLPTLRAKLEFSGDALSDLLFEITYQGTDGKLSRITEEGAKIKQMETVETGTLLVGQAIVALWKPLPEDVERGIPVAGRPVRTEIKSDNEGGRPFEPSLNANGPDTAYLNVATSADRK